MYVEFLGGSEARLCIDGLTTLLKFTPLQRLALEEACDRIDECSQSLTSIRREVRRNIVAHHLFSNSANYLRNDYEFRRLPVLSRSGNFELLRQALQATASCNLLLPRDVELMGKLILSLPSDSQSGEFCDVRKILFGQDIVKSPFAFVRLASSLSFSKRHEIARSLRHRLMLGNELADKTARTITLALLFEMTGSPTEPPLDGLAVCMARGDDRLRTFATDVISRLNVPKSVPGSSKVIRAVRSTR